MKGATLSHTGRVDGQRAWLCLLALLDPVFPDGPPSAPGLGLLHPAPVLLGNARCTAWGRNREKGPSPVGFWDGNGFDCASPGKGQGRDHGENRGDVGRSSLTQHGDRATRVSTHPPPSVPGQLRGSGRSLGLREPVAWSVLGGQPHPALPSRHTQQHQGVSPRARQGHSAVRPAEGDGDQPGRAPAARGPSRPPHPDAGLPRDPGGVSGDLGGPGAPGSPLALRVGPSAVGRDAGLSRGVWEEQGEVVWAKAHFPRGLRGRTQLGAVAPPEGACPPGLGDLVLGNVTVFPEESPAGAGLRGGGGFRRRRVTALWAPPGSPLLSWRRQHPGSLGEVSPPPGVTQCSARSPLAVVQTVP